MKSSSIQQEAKAEYEKEKRRAQIDVVKNQLRTYDNRSLWDILFPWVITITRKHP